MKKILIVRRDNIGDLICTLPLIKSIRELNKDARIDLLVNSYCYPVVANNNDVDHVYFYTKAKHRQFEGAFSVYWRRLLLTLKLRKTRYDWLVLANVGYSPRPLRWAKLLGAKNVVGFIDSDALGQDRVITNPIPLDRSRNRHEVEYLIDLLRPFGVISSIPSVSIKPNFEVGLAAKQKLRDPCSITPLIGINISARLPSQQWPAECFVALIKELTLRYRCVLFWAPGAIDSATHPGDDLKAVKILEACGSHNLIPYQTQTLEELIAGIFVVDLLVTADGGAMHIGAACRKPVVALFGDSNSKQWYPWSVPHLLLQPESRNVRDISSCEVSEAVYNLLRLQQ